MPASRVRRHPRRAALRGRRSGQSARRRRARGTMEHGPDPLTRLSGPARRRSGGPRAEGHARVSAEARGRSRGGLAGPDDRHAHQAAARADVDRRDRHGHRRRHSRSGVGHPLARGAALRSPRAQARARGAYEADAHGRGATDPRDGGPLVGHRHRGDAQSSGPDHGARQLVE